MARAPCRPCHFALSRLRDRDRCKCRTWGVAALPPSFAWQCKQLCGRARELLRNSRVQLVHNHSC
eukprot:11980632-Alexandrium_andersonii.AAC.1